MGDGSSFLFRPVVYIQTNYMSPHLKPNYGCIQFVFVFSLPIRFGSTTVLGYLLVEIGS